MKGLQCDFSLCLSIARQTAVSRPCCDSGMPMAAGFMSLSPIICGFISLPMRSETTDDASVACLEAKSAGFVSELILLCISSVSQCWKKMRFFFTCCGCFVSKCLFNLFFLRDSLDSNFITQYTLLLFSSMIFDRSESQVQNSCLLEYLPILKR